MGLVNLSATFAPVGTLSVTQANGKTVALSGVTGSMIAGGAFGNLAAVRTKLASTTALDTYARNFTVDLSRTDPDQADVSPRQCPAEQRQ